MGGTSANEAISAARKVMRRGDECKSDKDDETSVVDQPQETGPWDPALASLSEWDPAWAATCVKMTTNPWTAGVLPRKFIELVSVGLNAACTNLNPDGTRRHIRAALEAGATREEILFVLKMRVRSCRSIRAASARQFCWRKPRPRA